MGVLFISDADFLLRAIAVICSEHRMLARSGSVVLSGVARKAVADITTASRTVTAGSRLWSMVKGKSARMLQVSTLYIDFLVG